MKIVNAAQRTAEWFKWRREGISASELSVIVRENPHKTPWRLWMEIKGRLLTPNLDKSPPVRRGKTKEDLARIFFEKKHDEVLLPACVESDEKPIFRASLDGINSLNEPVELKCPTPTVMAGVLAEMEKSEAYQLYWYQVQHQIYVTGAQKGYLCFYCDELEPGKVHWIEFEIQRDNDFIDNEMIPSGNAFFELLKADKEPKKDPERDFFVPSPGADFNAWKIAAETWLDNFTRVKIAEEEIKLKKAIMKKSEATMVSMMGEFLHTQMLGVKISRYKQRGSVDWATLIQSHLPDLEDSEIEKFRKPDAERVRIGATNDSVQPLRVEKAQRETAKITAEAAPKIKGEGVHNW